MKEEELYDQVTASLLKLLSMRLAISFSVGTETATVLRRMHGEDIKLKEAIGKLYKKLILLESKRDPKLSLKFSDCIIDLCLCQINPLRGESESEVFSDSVTRNSELTSLAIDENNLSLA